MIRHEANDPSFFRISNWYFKGIVYWDVIKADNPPKNGGKFPPSNLQSLVKVPPLFFSEHQDDDMNHS